MITEKIIDSFIYETMDHKFMVMNPTEFDQVIPGGPWNNKQEAEEAFVRFVNDNEIVFE
jgi:hypothetical protein